jgi:hypothetical protein
VVVDIINVTVRAGGVGFEDGGSGHGDGEHFRERAVFQDGLLDGSRDDRTFHGAVDTDPIDTEPLSRGCFPRWADGLDRGGM